MTGNVLVGKTTGMVKGDPLIKDVLDG